MLSNSVAVGMGCRRCARAAGWPTPQSSSVSDAHQTRETEARAVRTTDLQHWLPSRRYSIEASMLSFHSFDPLSPRCPRLERLAEVLRLASHLHTLEFHDADHVKRLPVIRHDEFADPKIAAAKHASHGEMFRARLGDARRLNVGSTSDALARLRIVENCVSSVDLVLRRELVGVRGRPVALQGDA